MKKILAFLLTLCVVGFNSAILADEPKEPRVLDGPNGYRLYNDAPVWDEYVAPKYRNPRTDFERKSSTKELIWGAVLTDLIVTAPVGVPMLIHGTSKLKMISYARRKALFEKEIQKAQLIEDDNLRADEYKRILKECGLKESNRKRYAKKATK